MSTPPVRQRMPTRLPPYAGPRKTYAFMYAPGPQWVAGRPGPQQNLGAHRAYIADLCARGRVLFGGTFLDEAGGGFAVVRAQNRDEASARLAADPAFSRTRRVALMLGSSRKAIMWSCCGATRSKTSRPETGSTSLPSASTGWRMRRLPTPACSISTRLHRRISWIAMPSNRCRRCRRA
jgi:hypothetical protein